MKLLNSSIVAVLSSCMMTATPGALAQSSNRGLPNPPPSTDKAIPPETLDKLLAPIALYPDALILQIVQCASSPYQVRQVSDWLKQNPDLKGSAAQHAAATEGFDANFVAIVLFPQVVQMMADRPDWTRDLGQAFTTDRNGVFDSIQRLRARAQAAGNLKTTEEQEVQAVTTQSGQQVIVIQPANPQVVYVPQYNPQVVYTQTAPATSRTQADDGSVAGAALLGFAAGVIVGAAADDDDDHYYYAYGGWGYHGAALCTEGWNDYYQHRENMANDYYDHRENMADQRGENQGSRQDARGENQSTRQDTRGQNQDARGENQSARQDTRGQNQDARGENQSTRQDTRSGNRSTRQSTATGQRASGQTNRGATASRGTSQNRAASSSRTTGANSGAFSGYQRGSTERASSSRGHQSMSGRSGGSRSGGGRSGGGGRR